MNTRTWKLALHELGLCSIVALRWDEVLHTPMMVRFTGSCTAMASASSAHLRERHLRPTSWRTTAVSSILRTSSFISAAVVRSTLNPPRCPQPCGVLNPRPAVQSASLTLVRVSETLEKCL